MDNINKAIVQGNVGDNPKIHVTKSGVEVTNMDVATTQHWIDSAGVSKSATEWHRIVLWGKLAVIAHEQLRKGSGVYLEGKAHTRKFIKNDIVMYSTEIIVDKHNGMIKPLNKSF